MRALCKQDHVSLTKCAEVWGFLFFAFCVSFSITYPFKGNVEAQETERRCNSSKAILTGVERPVLYVESAYLVASRERVRVRLTDDGGGANESF